MISMDAPPPIIALLRRITSTQGWTAEPTVLLGSAGVGLRLTAGPGRKGVKRETFLLVADTYAHGLRALADVLDHFASQDQ